MHTRKFVINKFLSHSRELFEAFRVATANFEMYQIDSKKLWLLLLLAAVIFITPAKVAAACQDRFDECAEHKDDCVGNPGFMAINCPLTCSFCHLRSYKQRCNKEFLNISSEPFLRPGDVTKIFKRIISSSSSSSSSAAASISSVSEMDVDSVGGVSASDWNNRNEIYTGAVEVLSEEPYILKFPQFLSLSETDDILAYPDIAYERSTGSAKVMNELGEVNSVTDEVRTSSSFWCRSGCKDRDITRAVSNRISSLGNFALPPVEHWEPFQLLKYEAGEYYRTHHDFSADELELACGPRIFTFFVYLSDVDEGGNTSFPLTKPERISIMPKKGDAVLWANVENKRPTSKDIRTTHEANAVKSGVKFGMNIWMHLFNWETANRWACSG